MTTAQAWDLSPGPDGYRRPPAPPPRYGLALLLLGLTFLTTTTFGAFWSLAVRTSISTDLVPLPIPSQVLSIWSDPELLGHGLRFSLPALFILLCHEMGHYLTCRYYRLQATLPYFLPLPAFLGTLGAFIKIRSPIRTKRQLFDVGISGPLAGFVALLPFLILGIAFSEPQPFPTGDVQLAVPGEALSLKLASLAIHGPLPEGWILDLHPFALAAWFGLLATALNLIPLGQLDGGHILYAAVGRVQRKLALPIWALLAFMAWIWPGWLLWCALVLIMGLRHPPVQDEALPLDPWRRRLAWVALLILVLSWMPVPLDFVTAPP